MFTIAMSLTTALALFASGVCTMPTGTSCEKPSQVAVPTTGVTHKVIAGANGQLRFEPEIIVAAVGDIVEFQFHPKNHSVAQSSFAEPCTPLAEPSGVTPPPPANVTGYSSAYSRRSNAGGNVINANPFFAVLVKDTKPIWFYCPQPTGAHCTNGMSGVVNEPLGGPNTLAAYKEAAKGKATVTPPRFQGGKKVARVEKNHMA
ncbi:uncharacterized protein PG998_001183 [Apiospora kogelbergensis]|uniref:uncharacterized protein n=1 Tax=Apiospora kogelbergensis TaxID=1337665 RepID=UPI0031304ED0